MAKAQDPELFEEDESVESELIDAAAEPDESVESPPVETAEPEEPAPPSWRELAGRLGVDLSSYEDDESAVKYLAEQARAAREQGELAKYGEQYVNLAASGDLQKYEQWKAEQAQQADAQPKFFGDKPDWNPNWLQQLRQDENGNIVPDVSKGGTPETVARFQKYLAWRQDLNDRFLTDPEGFLGPYVEHVAEQRAAKIIEQKLSEFGSEIDARHFVLANDWLWEDKAKKILSADGKYFSERYQEINKDPDYANMTARGKERLALEKLEAFQATRQAAKKPVDKKAETLKKAAGFTPSSGGSTNQTAADGSPLAQDDHATLADMLREGFSAAGHNMHDELELVEA